MLQEPVEALTILAPETPLVLVFEDLHWSGTATLEILSVLVQRHASARVLVVDTYRPEEVRTPNQPL